LVQEALGVFAAASARFAYIGVVEGVARGNDEQLFLQVLDAPATAHLVGETMLRRLIMLSGSVAAATAVDADPTTWRAGVGEAIRLGRVEFTRWALGSAVYGEIDDDHTFLADSLAAGSLELADEFVQRGWPLLKERSGRGWPMSYAAESGRVEVLEWLAARSQWPTDEAMMVAASQGHWDVMVWLAQHGCPMSETVAYAAARTQSVPTLAWLLAHGCPYDPSTLVLEACDNPHSPDVLTWLLDQRMPFDQLAFSTRRYPAANAAVVHQRFGTPLPPFYLGLAAHASNLDMVRYGLANGALTDNVDLESVLLRPECAILHEFLSHVAVDGTLPLDSTRRVDEAVNNIQGHVHGDCISILAQYGYALSP
jgi:hypothetical protein